MILLNEMKNSLATWDAAHK